MDGIQKNLCNFREFFGFNMNISLLPNKSSGVDILFRKKKLHEILYNFSSPDGSSARII